MSERIQEYVRTLRSDEDPDSRRLAAEALEKYKGAEVVQALADALADDDKGVRDAAGRSLQTIGGPEVAGAVVQYLEHQDIVFRNFAAGLLFRLGEDSIPALKPQLAHADQDVRKMAVDTLGLLRFKEAEGAIIPLLHDSDANVVVSTVEALGSVGSESAIPHLIALYEQEEYVRPTVAEAMGKIGGSAASKFLSSSFQKAITGEHSDPLLLFGIIEALGLIGDPEAFGLLGEHLPSVKGRLRRMMLAAMVWIADKSGMSLEIPGASTQDLIGLMDDSDLRVRLNAVRALSNINDHAVTKAFVNALGESDYFDAVLFGLLEIREDALPLVFEKLRDPATPNRKELVGLLRAMARRASFLPGELRDEAWSLTEQQWEAADEEARGVIVETLFLLDGDRTLVLLDTVMSDPDPWLRMRVIELLGTLNDARLPEFLSRFRNDEDEMVRQTTEWVLQSKGHSFNANETI